MINPIYTLPEISFVGGESQTYKFNLLTLRGNSFDAESCSVAFSVVAFCNKNGSSVITKDAEIVEGTPGIFNIAEVILQPEDTIDLYGRYVYQISIMDKDGLVEIPGQGIMNIQRNIHKHFVTQ